MLLLGKGLGPAVEVFGAGFLGYALLFQEQTQGLLNDLPQGFVLLQGVFLGLLQKFPVQAQRRFKR